MTLDNYLQSRKLTQDALAQKAGLSASYLSQLLSRKRRASPEIALKIEEATDGEVTAASLLGLGHDGGSAIPMPGGRWVLRPDAGGSVVIPVRLLEEFGAEFGEPIGVERTEDGMAVTFILRAVRRSQDDVARFIPPGVSIVDEFIAEKRGEAERE